MVFIRVHVLPLTRTQAAGRLVDRRFRDGALRGYFCFITIYQSVPAGVGYSDYLLRCPLRPKLTRRKRSMSDVPGQSCRAQPSSPNGQRCAKAPDLSICSNGLGKRRQPSVYKVGPEGGRFLRPQASVGVLEPEAPVASIEATAQADDNDLGLGGHWLSRSANQIALFRRICGKPSRLRLQP